MAAIFSWGWPLYVANSRRPRKAGASGPDDGDQQRKAEMGQVMQGLIYADQPPEAGLGGICVERAPRHPLGAVDGEMHDEIYPRHPDVGRRPEIEDQRGRRRVNRDMDGERNDPALFSLL